MTQPNVADPLAAFGPAIRTALENWRTAVDRIRRQVEANTSLTPGGRGEAHAAGIAAIRPQWADHAATLGAQIAAVVDDTRSAALDLLPDPASGVEGILDRTARWGRWMRYLQSQPTIRPQQVIAGASDPEDLYMLADELPMWYAADGSNDTVTDVIPVLILRRLAQVTSPQAEAAWHAADLAAITAARLQPMLDFLTAEIGEPRRQSAMYAAASGDMAAGQARAALGWST